MKRKYFMHRRIAAVLTAALIGAAGAVQAAETDERVDPAFKKYDTNRDG
jgi:hypothetical protein